MSEPQANARRTRGSRSQHNSWSPRRNEDEVLLEVVAEVEAEAEEEEVEDLEARPDDPMMMISFCRCQS